MTARLLVLFFVVSTHSLFAAVDVLTTVVDEKSPDFVLGKSTRRGLLIKSQDNPEMSLSVGARMQGTVEGKESAGIWSSDVYGRRIRFELTASFSKRLSYTMDIRNDRANQGDGGERNFVTGNAFVLVREVFGLPYMNFQAFRSKIDVSRAQTVSSGQQLYYDRPYVTDFAQSYVSHNRRAANLQLNGSYEGKLRYQVAAGDGVSSATFLDAKGKLATSISRQDPMMGGKIILSPIPGLEEHERTQNYFGRGKHASVGAGYYRTGSISFKPTAAAASEAKVTRGLLNVESSFAYGPVFLQAEFFRFTGQIQDFSAAGLNEGTSEGWYVAGEYVLTDLAYLAPHVRYERWNRFKEDAGFMSESMVAGVNWYLQGNSVRVGFAVQRDWTEGQVGSGSETIIRATSQVHF